MRITHETADQLLIHDPPAYLLGGLLILVGAVLVRVAFPGRSDDGQGLLWLALVPGAVLLVAGLIAAGGSGLIKISSDSGTLIVQRRLAGAVYSAKEIELASIAGTRIETNRGNRTLWAVTHDGRRVRLSGLGTWTGLDAAANAIERRLR